MAADLGITRIYASEKMVGMKTNMSKKVFKLITDSIASDAHRNSLEFEDDQIKVVMHVCVCICRSVVCTFLFGFRCKWLVVWLGMFIAAPLT